METKIREIPVEIKSKLEVLWNKSLESVKQRIKDYEEALIIDKAFLELCEKKILDEELRE